MESSDYTAHTVESLGRQQKYPVEVTELAAKSQSKKSLISHSSRRSGGSKHRGRRPSLDDAERTIWPDPKLYPNRSLFLFTLHDPLRRAVIFAIEYRFRLPNFRGISARSKIANNPEATPTDEPTALNSSNATKVTLVPAWDSMVMFVIVFNTATLFARDPYDIPLFRPVSPVRDAMDTLSKVPHLKKDT